MPNERVLHPVRSAQRNTQIMSGSFSAGSTPALPTNKEDLRLVSAISDEGEGNYIVTLRTPASRVRLLGEPVLEGGAAGSYVEVVEVVTGDTPTIEFQVRDSSDAASDESDVTVHFAVHLDRGSRGGLD